MAPILNHIIKMCLLCEGKARKEYLLLHAQTDDAHLFHSQPQTWLPFPFHASSRIGSKCFSECIAFSLLASSTFSYILLSFIIVILVTSQLIKIKSIRGEGGVEKGSKITCRISFVIL